MEYGLCPNPKFKQYVYRQNAGIDNNLLNLETTLLGLSVMCKPAEKSFFSIFIPGSKDQEKLMPTPHTDYISILSHQNENLKTRDAIAYEYIKHTLNQLKDQKAEQMPQKLKEKFISEHTREKTVKQFAEKNQNNIMRQNHAADVIQQQLDQKNKEGLIPLPTNSIPTEPLINTHVGIVNQHAVHGDHQQFKNGDFN